MFKLQDGIMLGATLSSILIGILLPNYGIIFSPYPIYCMMVLLFFSFLNIRLSAVFQRIRNSAGDVCYYLFLKLIFLPLIVFISFRHLFPKYALAALLLSGTSSGVSSPFFAILVCANLPIVIGMVVTSSILVPLTLPLMVHLLAGKEMQISFLAMTQLLGFVVFVPLCFSEVLRRLIPSLCQKLARVQYGVSIICFVITNLGIFSRYAPYLREEPSTVLEALAISALLAGFYFAAGILFSHRQPLEDRLSAIISFGLMNNVLVLVFSSEFFSPLEPTVAAIYTIPFFSLIIPLRLYQNWGSRLETGLGPQRKE